MSADGAGSVGCKCQGDVPQEAIKDIYIFQIQIPVDVLNQNMEVNINHDQYGMY